MLDRAPPLERARQALSEPWDGAGLAVFRCLFGAMMAFSLTRFWALGWVERVFVEPTFFFKYAGFEWTTVWGSAGLHLHFAVVGVAAVGVALGLFYRWSLLVFWLGFTYIQLLDVTLYLNHYYLVVLVAGLMLLMPLGRVWSLDGRRGARSSTVPAWCYVVLRLQLTFVYFYAALAKVQTDWLVYGEPMSTWIRAHIELPIIGPWLALPGMGLFLSWCGFLYDATIWALLWRSRTRRFAFVLVVVFHLSTWLFFDIGMFPIIMIVGSTVFFDPSWPRALIGLERAAIASESAGLVVARGGKLPSVADRREPKAARRADRPRTSDSGAIQADRCSRRWLGSLSFERRPERPLHILGVLGLGAYLAVQALLPLRFLFHDGPVIWHERGMRFSWKVMVREKNGSVSYRVYSEKRARPWKVSAMDYLTWRQFSDMSGQPDLILQLGQHVAADFERKGLGPIRAVHADAWVSLNGRPPVRLVDPDVDLRTIQDAKDLDRWILPAPRAAPPRAASGWL